MRTTAFVEYHKFIALNGLDLCRYMEPLLSRPETQVSRNVLERMRSELPTYDEYHVVYALTLGAKFSPETFALHLPAYLAHELGSVWSCALRCLDQLPDKYITDALICLIRDVQGSCPAKTWIGELLGRLEERMLSNGRDTLSGQSQN